MLMNTISFDSKAWAKAKTYNPQFDELLKKIENPWSDSKPTKEHVRFLKSSSTIYN
jgi:hypothetical protein